MFPAEITAPVFLAFMIIMLIIATLISGKV